MYGSGAETTKGYAPTTRSLGDTVAPRDTGTFGMAANRLRDVNRSLDQVIGHLRQASERINENGSPKVAGGTASELPPPAQTIPGLLRELEATETLVKMLFDAIQFTESL